MIVSHIKLPKSWIVVELKDIYTIVGGGTPSTNKLNYWQGTIPWISSADIYAINDIRPRKMISKQSIENSTTNLVPKDSIIVVTRVGLGKIAIAPFPLCFSQDNQALINTSLIDQKYALHYLSTAVQVFKYQNRGTTIPGVTKKQLNELAFLLPPLNEQHRIVAKLETLFTKLDKAVEALTMAKAQVKRYRQAVLKAAFEGKLTEAWRKKNNIALITDADMKKIATERDEELHKIGLKVKSNLREDDYSNLPKLPEGWLWVKPDDVCSPEKYSIGIGPFGSNLKVSDYTSSGVPLVFVKNITRNDFSLNLKYVTKKKYSELIAHSTRPLDILITKMGDPPGDSAIYPANMPEAIITADCLKFRVWDKYANRMFFKYCIDTKLIKRQLGLITRGVAQKKISVERFKTLYFPYTSIDEQVQIVKEIDHHFSIAENAEKTLDKSIEQAKRLRQSILKKAFEGRLVEQDPKDEPASVLLERIKAEREKLAAETAATKAKKPDRVIREKKTRKTIRSVKRKRRK